MRTQEQLEQSIHVRNGRGPYGFTGFDLALNAEKVYIGRAMRGVSASPLGNPEKVTAHTVEEHNRAVGVFDDFIVKEVEKGRAGEYSPAFDELDRLADKVLSGKAIVVTCWCDPLPCHGQSVKREVVDRALEKQQEQSSSVETQLTVASPEQIKLVTASNAIQSLCQSEAFGRALDPHDYGTEEAIGIENGGCLMIACALRGVVGSRNVQLLSSVDPKEPGEMPVFMHAAVQVMVAGETYYVDGNGIQSEAEWRHQWVESIERDGYEAALEPLTPTSLQRAIDVQGAYYSNPE